MTASSSVASLPIEASAVPGKWSDGKAAALLLTVADPPGPYFGLTETERVRVILFDVSGSAVLIGIDSQAGSTFDALVADAMPIVESMQFSP